MTTKIVQDDEQNQQRPKRATTKPATTKTSNDQNGNGQNQQRPKPATAEQQGPKARATKSATINQ
jgi:hypothetical protein